METVGGRGKSRRQERSGRMRKRKRESHFPTVRYGGFEENQIICYLWELVKSVESIGGKLKAGIKPGGENRIKECLGELADLEKQM